MTELLACVRDEAEAALILAAGFDGVVRPRAHGGSGSLAGWIEGASDAPALVLAAPDGTTRRFVLRHRPEIARGAGAGGRDGILLSAHGRLLDEVPMPALAGFVAACRERGAAVGLAGALEPPDVPRLMALRPDVLLFGKGLRAGGAPDAPFEGARVEGVRALVPRGAPAAAPAAAPTRPDRIFVRDLVLDLDIGAYRSERGRAQRVRFAVEAALDEAAPAADRMQDVVSYDLITDAVHRAVALARVDFLEPLAETIAADLLEVTRIREVVVRIEKLDRGPGAVGVEIARGR